MFQHNSLFIFDIETIADTDVVFKLTNNDSKNIIEQRKALEDYHLKITDGKNPFVRQLFHRVVCISFVYANLSYDVNGQEFYTLKEVRSGGSLDSTEKELIEGFFKNIEKNKPRLVTFNGRTFDIPVLKYRAMKYGISSSFFYSGGDKWNNYGSRYSNDWHCDLLDVLSDFGGSARIKLDEVCALLGLPGKIGDVDGSKVAEYYDKGKLDDIRSYCETDVLNTYLVYLYMMRHQGKISETSFDNSVIEVDKFLKENKAKKHFNEFLTAWQGVDEPVKTKKKTSKSKLK